MRLNQAPAPTFTDAAGNNEKGRPCQRGCDRRRPVVSIEFKPTGASAINTRASLTSTHPGERTHEAGKHIVASFTRQRKNGADNEHSAFRQTSPSNQRTHRRLFDSLD